VNSNSRVLHCEQEVKKAPEVPPEAHLPPAEALAPPLLANASDTIAVRFSAFSGLSYHRGIHSTLKKKKKWKRIALTS